MIEGLDRGDIIINRYPGDASGREWYVQEVSLLDLGRFKTKQEAEHHMNFMIERRRQ